MRPGKIVVCKKLADIFKCKKLASAHDKIGLDQLLVILLVAEHLVKSTGFERDQIAFTICATC